MSNLRLDKLLADTGRWSRKEARELVKQGRVRVNGQPVRSPEEKYDPAGLSLTVDGTAVLYEAYTYLMLNKPAGLLSATQDRKQKTVLDLLPPELQKRGLFPVGRLDRDSTGLLLLTNHGELAHRLLSPRHHVDKVYLVQTEGEIDAADCAAFARGMTLGDGEVCLPAGLEPLENRPGWCLVTLREGKFHQVKRMLAARGKPVLSLERLSMGNLHLDKALDAGEYRALTPNEVENLLQSAGLGTKKSQS
ncbi:MAG: rRNA pseudouridine synthase [Oscillospiraceae bacterium]|nr:rRNA pseudouridine synthase [Oscillospiraceae bacterium]